jgi:hypothetical protein
VVKIRGRGKWVLGFGLAGLIAAGLLVTGAATGTAAGTPIVCAPTPSPSGTGYWTPFGDAHWTATGLQTSSRADSAQPFGVTCGGASVYGSALPTSDPNKVTALSFDFIASTTGPSGDSPRLVVCFSDGANCASNGSLAPVAWTAGQPTHVDGFAPAAHGDVWSNEGGSCAANVANSFSAVAACHPGASVTQVAVVNDGGSQYPAGEQVVLNNMMFNNVIAHDTPPVLGQQAEIAPLSGSVLVRPPGSKRFHRVKTIQPLRYGAVVHATRGHLQVIAATPGNGFQSGQFFAGGFNLSQNRSGYVQAQLTGRPTGCSPEPGANTAAGKPKTFKLWGHVKGHYRTRGNYGSASVRGTVWLTENRCSGTFFFVRKGTLRIRDFVRHKTIILHAGHSYLARRPVHADTFDHDGDYQEDLAAGLFKAR